MSSPRPPLSAHKPGCHREDGDCGREDDSGAESVGQPPAHGDEDPEGEQVSRDDDVELDGRYLRRCRAMRGAAVAMIVPSRFSMKKAPATKRARPVQAGRCLRTILNRLLNVTRRRPAVCCLRGPLGSWPLGMTTYGDYSPPRASCATLSTRPRPTPQPRASIEAAIVPPIRGDLDPQAQDGDDPSVSRPPLRDRLRNAVLKPVEPGSDTRSSEASPVGRGAGSGRQPRH